MKNKGNTLHCQAQKLKRKSGKLSGWIGQHITFAPQDSDTTYFYHKAHDMKAGEKYLVVSYSGGDFRIQTPNNDLLFLSPENFKEFQSPA